MEDSDLASSFIPALYKPPSLLPIARHREGILYLVETYPVVVVVGQTGSGKSTQICQYLDQTGWCADGKAIAVTQVGQYRAPNLDGSLTVDLDISPEESRRRQWPRE